MAGAAQVVATVAARRDRVHGCDVGAFAIAADPVAPVLACMLCESTDGDQVGGGNDIHQ